MPDADEQSFDLRTQARPADETHAYIHDQGFYCHGCQHRHHGAGRGFECTGCRECPPHQPTLPDFEFMRRVEWIVNFTYHEVEVRQNAPRPKTPKREVN